ncbi:MAG: patatin-like phospholipase family protein [Mediterranea sp.]|jgi:NTE family protein|nr:patatin-like phospholipase family protein [Mediterranea sp.]
MIKQFFYTIVLGALLLFSPTTRAQEPHRLKVGVVLSGGGAKGMAHINALKVIEEAGIPIDYVAGTSMGAIVGGLYAMGYTPQQLDSMVRKQDWGFLFSDRIRRSALSISERESGEKYVVSLPFNRSPKDAATGGLIRGLNLENLFSDLTIGYHDSIDFDHLPTPFACVAANVVNGEQVVFRSGILGHALRASMAIPGVFAPVRQDSMVLVDGGIVNNYPADVVRQMGADVVIGVDVQSELKSLDKLNTAPDILMQIIDLATRINHEQNVKLTDTYIKVDIRGYNSASFTASAIDTLMRRGEEAARTHWDELLALKKRIGVAPDYRPPRHGPYVYPHSRTAYVTQINFSGIEKSDQKWLMKRCKLTPESYVTPKQVEQAIYLLRGSQSYSGANYTLMRQPDGSYHLNFLAEEKYEKKISLGIRFDSEEIASVLVNGTANFKTGVPSHLSITGRLGKRYMARVDYTLEPLRQRNINLAYMYRYNDINIYERGKRAYNTTYSHHLAELSFTDLWYRNLRFALGARFEAFEYKDILLNPLQQDNLDIDSEHFISYFAQAQFNTFDKGYFPDRGTDFRMEYALYTDNLVQYEDHAPFSALSGSWESVIHITRRFAMLPSLYGRVLIGRGIPYAMRNAIGNDTPGFYIPQQLSMAGMSNLQLTENAVMIARLKFRQRMGGIHFLTLNLNYGLAHSHFFELLHGKALFGVSAGYGMNSVFGPLEISLGYSNQTHKGNCFINLGYYF